jgi:SAM-dependent methyltransferase
VGEHCRSLLDVGCGVASPIGTLGILNLKLVGVDLHLPSLKSSKQEGLHDLYVQMDALTIADVFGANSFDCVIALDLIEHFTKDDGYRLIEAMEAVARKRAIIFTPNGYLPQIPIDDNLLQEHQSGWDYLEMAKLGYKVYGIHGWRSLRGERAEIRFKPRLLGMYLAKLTQLVVESRPKYAFQIMCVKSL